MRTIWKFPVQQHRDPFTTTVRIKAGSHPYVVLVAHDPKGTSDLPTLWIEHDPDGPEQELTFEIVGTGHEAPARDSDRVHIGSCVTPGGFVWHMYQVVSLRAQKVAKFEAWANAVKAEDLVEKGSAGQEPA